jgi:hypothetical protein
MQRGNYAVDSFEFEENPNKEAARVAKFDWDKFLIIKLITMTNQ